MYIRSSYLLESSTMNERRQLRRLCFSHIPKGLRNNTDLPISYLVLHLPRLLRCSTEQKDTAGQPIQPVNGPEVLQVVLLRQDEDHGVVPVTTARMHLRSQNGSNGQTLFSYRVSIRSRDSQRAEDNNIDFWKGKIDIYMIGLRLGILRHLTTFPSPSPANLVHRATRNIYRK